MGIMAVAGPALIVVAIFMVVRTKLFMRRASETEGTVIGYETSSSDHSTNYEPIVRYTSADGQTHEFTDTGVSSNPPAFDKGEKVPVKYDPNRAGKARIDAAKQLWFTPGMLGVAGVVLLVTSQL